MLRLPEANPGSHSESDREAVPSKMFLLRGMRQELGRHPVHRRRHKSGTLHRRFSQVSTNF